ncbi:MAG: hypothetical protein A3B11_02020 [Candidatus Taylorbacteria bacterium RIFCSPLOWO2_01_FULL_44_26]|uniref:Polymerase nucleotidyl transferase domain-containing protein n=2 Tax=Candidatus Tayloriibacteriota TaxID=1817919 RepID=A0A1G2MLK4_9BACT|nr:MAG: hypothetical protein A3D50_00210 [Candidatus Taylorbacteria bacterium RIFCSPHIGHO2_02_FULL_44_12]OHA30746.1 MAG: hypothetical protein A3B11_02020 [Candidatus Taylorbacteria bacterium RIFCSPLOWO2_01_FULL_44_26]
MSIADIKNKLRPLFEAYGIIYAGVFGSVSRGEDLPDSDVDILVRLGKPMGMFSYMRLVHAIEDLLGRRVDMVTEKGLSKFVRPYVMPELKTIYERVMDVPILKTHLIKLNKISLTTK